MREKELKIIYLEADTTVLPKSDQDLLSSARGCCSNAYAPYSNFNVGAALLLDDGSIVTGTNQENAAYPSGLCAERNALFNYGSHQRHKKVIALAVTAIKSNTSKYVKAFPCGACRQVIAEYEALQKSPIKLILQNNDENVLVFKSIADLLPFSFSSKDID